MYNRRKIMCDDYYDIGKINSGLKTNQFVPDLVFV